MSEVLPNNVRCPGCGYDMSGLPSWVCPECGEDQSEHEKKLQARSNYLIGPCLSRRMIAYAILLPLSYAILGGVGLLDAGVVLLMCCGAIVGIGLSVILGKIVAWSAPEPDRAVVSRVWMRKLWILHLPWIVTPITGALLFLLAMNDAFGAFLLAMGAAPFWCLMWLLGLFVWIGESWSERERFGVRPARRLNAVFLISGLLTLAVSLLMSVAAWYVVLMIADVFFPSPPFLEGWEDF